MHIFHNYKWRNYARLGYTLGKCQRCGKIKRYYWSGSDYVVQMGRCSMGCGRWSGECYMDEEMSKWSSESSLACGECISDWERLHA